MKRSQRQNGDMPGPLSTEDPTGRPKADAGHPAPGQDRFDDVLPNLLLDVREAFLNGFRPVFRMFGVTDQQFRVLSVLHYSGDLEISKLARRCRIIGPSMTGSPSARAWVNRSRSAGSASSRRRIRSLGAPNG